MRHLPATPGTKADETLARDADKLREALVGLVRICQFQNRSRICCYDVSVTQCHAIEVLDRSGPLSLNALAAALYLDKTTASRVVGTLVRKKYVARRASPEDGRSILLRVTPAGTRLHESIRRDLNVQAAALLAGTGPQVRSATVQLLRKLAQAVASCCGADSSSTCTPATCTPACGQGGHPRSDP